MNSKTYIVFRCSNCGFYGLASPNQKTRLCVRCGKTMNLEGTHNRSVADFNEARRMIGELNSKRDSETLDEKERSQYVFAKIDSRVDPAKVTSKGLLRTFQDITLKHAKREIDLSELLGECETNGLPREYAQKLIERLVESGLAYRPGKGKIAFL